MFGLYSSQILVSQKTKTEELVQTKEQERNMTTNAMHDLGFSLLQKTQLERLAKSENFIVCRLERFLYQSSFPGFDNRTIVMSLFLVHTRLSISR